VAVNTYSLCLGACEESEPDGDSPQGLKLEAHVQDFPDKEMRLTQAVVDLMLCAAANAEFNEHPEALESPIPLPHLATLVLLSAWVVASDISQGSFRCGSWQYWAVTLSVLVPVASILLGFRQILLK
jgi:hypothetical protein